MLRVRVPLLAEVAGGTIVSAIAAADGAATASAIGASLFSSTALATGTCVVSAIGASIFSATALASGSSTVSAQGGGVNSTAAAASGTSTVSAQGAAAGNIQSAVASAVGTSTVTAQGASIAAAEALAQGSSQVDAQGSFIGVVSAAASASGSSTVSAQGKAVGGAASVPTKFARWASYQRRPGSFIRQVSPGVYLRAGKDKSPVVVVNDREIGPAEDVRGDRLAEMLSQGLGRRDARKIRKILRRLDEPPEVAALDPVPIPLAPKSTEAQKLIEEVNASMPRPMHTTVTVDYCEEEIAVLVALRMF